MNIELDFVEDTLVAMEVIKKTTLNHFDKKVIEDGITIIKALKAGL